MWGGRWCTAKAPDPRRAQGFHCLCPEGDRNWTSCRCFWISAQHRSPSAGRGQGGENQYLWGVGKGEPPPGALGRWRPGSGAGSSGQGSGQEGRGHDSSLLMLQLELESFTIALLLSLLPKGRVAEITGFPFACVCTSQLASAGEVSWTRPATLVQFHSFLSG